MSGPESRLADETPPAGRADRLTERADETAYPAPPLYPAPRGDGKGMGAQEAAEQDAAVADFLGDIARRKEFFSLRFRPRQPTPLAAVAAFMDPAAADRKADRAPRALDTRSPALEWLAQKGLALHGAQLFLRALFAPGAPYPRLLMSWQTGTGKTLGALALSMEYVRSFRARLILEPARQPAVFVVGFTERVFRAELLRHPELGFVSHEEVAELWRLRAAAEERRAAGPSAPEVRQWITFHNALRRRLTDRARGGYFTFFGYKEFASQLFVVTRSGAARGFDVQSLYGRLAGLEEAGARAQRRARARPPRRPAVAATDVPPILGEAKQAEPAEVGLAAAERPSLEDLADAFAAAEAPKGAWEREQEQVSVLPPGEEEESILGGGEDEEAPAQQVAHDFGAAILEAVRAGDMVINGDLLEALRGGLLIADEIHDVYNIQTKNIYGVALQYALDALGADAPRAIYLSATPTSGAATEIVDLFNLLIPRDELPGGAPLRRSDLFADPAPEDRRSAHGQEGRGFAVSQLLPGALEKIAHLAAGRVSFLLDTDTAAYPRRDQVGSAVPGIPYLSFLLCPMSRFHENTFDSVLAAPPAPDGPAEKGSAGHERPPPAPDRGGKTARGPRERGAGARKPVPLSLSLGQAQRKRAEEKVAPSATNRERGSEEAPGVRRSVLPPDALSLLDIAFPDPSQRPTAAVDDPSAVGLYDAADAAARIAAAPAAWRAAAGVEVVKEPAGAWILGGEFLRLETPPPRPAAAVPTPGGKEDRTPASAAAAPPGVRAYSAKYARFAELVLGALRARARGKMLAYHHRVRGSGALLIQELLNANGLIGETATPTDQTLCAVCGIPRASHGAEEGAERGSSDAGAQTRAMVKTKVAAADDGPESGFVALVLGGRRDAPESGGGGETGAHAYAPARYAMAHSDIDRGTMERSLARFNAPENADGGQIRILVGSKIIRQSITFLGVAALFVLSLPGDISTLIQVFGRVARRDSHVLLPPARRRVLIVVLASVRAGAPRPPEVDASGGAPVPRGAAAGGSSRAPATREEYVREYGLELARYAEKMREYLVIQEVVRAMRRTAVDGFANYGRLLAADPSLGGRATLDALPYRPAVELGPAFGLERPPLAVATFEAYGHSEREVQAIAARARVLFAARPVWTYADLWRAVRAADIRGAEHDPALFSEGNFALALRELERPVADPSRPGAVLAVAFAAPYYILAPAAPGGGSNALVARPDIESYLGRASGGGTPARSAPPAPLWTSGAARGPQPVAAFGAPPRGVSVRVTDFLRTRHQEGSAAFDADARAFAGRYLAGGRDPVLALVEVGGRFHQALMAALVENAARGGRGASAGVTGSAATDARAIDLYRRFRVLLTAADMEETAASPPSAAERARAAADAPAAEPLVADPRGGSTPAPAPRGPPIAVVLRRSVAVYDPRGAGLSGEKGGGGRGGLPTAAGPGWHEVPLASLGVGRRQKENDVAVGFVAEALASAAFAPKDEGLEGALSSGARFKLRPPIQELRAGRRAASGPGVDVRTLARGAVCETRPREELVKIIERLKAKLAAAPAFAARAEKAAAVRKLPSAPELCRSVKLLLLGLEEEARSRPQGMTDGLRWVYLWHDVAPVLASLR